MLLVRTKLGQSRIHGIGLFADQFISKGTSVWEPTPGFDLYFSKRDLDNLPKITKNYLAVYSYLDIHINKYVLNFDNTRFMNHSDDPNIISTYPIGNREGISIALRDIKRGEELTCNYKEFDKNYAEKLVQNYA